MLGDDRPGHRKERLSSRFARKLRLRPNVEERKVASNKVMRYSCSLIQDVDLTAEHVLGLLVVVRRNVACGPGLDTVEARSQVAW